VFPIDFSERSNAMAPCVREWARRFGARIAVVYAFDSVRNCLLGPGLEQRCASEHIDMPYTPAIRQLRDRRKLRLEEFAAEHFRGLNYATLVGDGEPATVIEWAVQKQGTDLVIMPTKGLGRFKRLLLGSITAKVLHGVRCPVLTDAHMVESAQRGEGYRSIVCGVEFHGEAVRVLEMAGFLAQTYKAQLSIVHAEASGATPSQKVADGDRLRTMLQHDFADAGIEVGDVNVMVVDGAVERGIQFAAMTAKADLVVVGRGHENECFGRVWSHLYSIVRESPCAVLSV
jgi:nucleotide-binding universal stress UspA family protein